MRMEIPGLQVLDHRSADSWTLVIPGGRCEVAYDPEDGEPFRSYPYVLTIYSDAGKRDDLRLGEWLYSAICEAGDYRVVLLVDGEPMRATSVDLDSFWGD
ncbi:hypothetical protein Afil01_31240 [Actinorhabdospora filicis]|uniref:Uncharacterized protein n=1 Tax=Actinorhabdospora filicis TaxID=1785913 RepID=A0A9W6SM54_9ACTN|nr:hypothetical protein Afil01_31240 [Actinorhabdospora filicis]